MIFHKKNGYNFDAKHIARILELIILDTDRFASVLKTNSGCGLKRICKEMSAKGANVTSSIVEATKDAIDTLGLANEVREYIDSENAQNDKKEKQSESVSLDLNDASRKKKVDKDTNNPGEGGDDR